MEAPFLVVGLIVGVIAMLMMMSVGEQTISIYNKEEVLIEEFTTYTMCAGIDRTVFNKDHFVVCK